MKTAVLLVVCAVGCGSAAELQPDAGLPDAWTACPAPDARTAVLPTGVTAPPENPFSPEKAVLGKILFWDEQLSSDDTVACGTCHRPAAGGGDPRAVHARHPGADGKLGTDDDPHGSPGIARCRVASGTVMRLATEPTVTRRKAPSYLDAMAFPDLFWDGRARGAFVDPETHAVAIAAGGALESQAVGPPLNDGEMACEGRTWADVRAKLERVRPLALATDLPPDVRAALCAQPTYPRLFAAAFGTPEITARRIAFAIATHERTLRSDQTPWDRWSAGEPGALTAAQESGRVAYAKGLCGRCHRAPTFATDLPANLGFADATWDMGLREVTGLETDHGKFQSVTLRNVGLREPGGLLHDGAMGMALLMDLYNVPPGNLPNTDPRMVQTLGLTDQEVADLVEFVRTGLTDPRVAAETWPFDRPTLASEHTQGGK